MKSVIAIRHVHFEGLGTFEPVLREAGYRIEYLDAGTDSLAALDPLQPELLAVLGAPVSVYDTDIYPFLAVERELLVVRLKANLPTLGICLGAQQIAAALGAQVEPAAGKEIGFAPVTLTEDGRSSPLRHLKNIPVLHWHGDSFAIPAGAIRLAETPLCRNQAFLLGSNVLGLQFHPEADTAKGLEAWLVGHACELAAARIDPRTIRRDASQFGDRLLGAARAMLLDWLNGWKDTRKSL